MTGAAPTPAAGPGTAPATPGHDTDVPAPPPAPGGAGAPGEVHDSAALSGSSEADAPPAERDWPWVEEWRASREPVPWATGLPLALFTATVVAVAVYALSQGLAGTPLLAIGVNVFAAAGLAPAMWLARGLPVLRWFAGGTVLGVLVGWFCVLVLVPVPAVG